MDRREFLQKAALTGLAVAAPTLIGKTARAAVSKYTGPFFIFINANGGWNPTDLSDPKGRANELEANPLNTYMTGDILQQGNITFAPHPGFGEFLTKYGSRMTVVRGIDLSTNGHGEGLRHSFSGKLPEGNPSLASLIAATYAPQLPTSFLTAGGFDETKGVVGATRIGNPGVLQSIAFPNQINPTEMNNQMMQMQNTPLKKRLFHRESVAARIERYRTDRLNTMLGNQRLPHVKTALNELYTAGLDQDTLKLVAELIPNPLSRDRFESQVQIALAAYKAGASISMSIGFGGFDTHGNHDATHIPQLTQMLGKIDFLWDEADRLGISDRVFMMASSEMGRTPHYNAGRGKDHWSITGAIMMGYGVEGNRVIGSTNEGVEANKIDPGTLQVRDANDKEAVTMTPAIIHASLRELAGVNPDFDRAFPLGENVPQLKLFGA